MNYKNIDIISVRLLPKILTFLAFFVLFLIGLFFIFYTNRIYPNTYVSGINISNLSREEAQVYLQDMSEIPTEIKLTDGPNTYEVNLQSVDFRYDPAGTITKILSGQKITSLEDYVFAPTTLFENSYYNLSYSISDLKLEEYIDVLSSKVNVKKENPGIKVDAGVVVVTKGKKGKELNKSELKETLLKNLSYKKFSPIEIPFKTEGKEINEEEATKLRERANRLRGKNILLTYKVKTINIKSQDILTFLDPFEKYNDESILKFVEESVTPEINSEAQNATFREEEGKIVEFKAGRDGVEVDREKLTTSLKEALQKLEEAEEKTVTIEVQVNKISPKVATGEVNDLGVKELLGVGTSTFKGSIPGRIHNVNLASNKLNGILIKPGEEFSFNNALGDISSLTGYKQAYIIKDGRTILGDGGGVCQTSTTLFRAALNAGLPITERRAHAYRVGYYEQDSPPGLDATVFSPTTDFKFKNDTPGHLLVQTFVDLKNLSLTYEIYGTSDGRKSTVTKPVITSQIAPAEDLYQDDPNLPLGKIQQVEHKAWGAKVLFDYTVERNGEVIYKKSFVSNYRPWQAVYLRGTKVN